MKLVEHIAGKKIFVGLSGGVDSGVTAALLQEAGADVYGVFIKGWYPPELPCTWATDRQDAMRVAAHLRMPFHTFDAAVEYKKSVIDYLIREYGEGRTPNPDIMCNRDVKFGAFYDFAKEHEADYIATGHYARQENDSLLRGIDTEKDQSYFLWAISKEALSMTLFPLGDKKKTNVRELAKKYKLPNALKKDSQGICFLGPVSMDDFLHAELTNEPGKALDEMGKEIGIHEGVLLSTLGERITLQNAESGPWYVLKKDIPKNILTVSKERKTMGLQTRFALADVNWFKAPALREKITAQYRYHGPVISGSFDADMNIFVPDTGVAEPLAHGQSLVFYRGDEVLGGGIIG